MGNCLPSSARDSNSIRSQTLSSTPGANFETIIFEITLIMSIFSYSFRFQLRFFIFLPSIDWMLCHFSGTSSNYSKNVGFSGTSSTAGKSQFSDAASVDVSEPYPNGQILDQPNLKEFNFAELKIATKNFKLENLLGQGGFGKVYRGWVDEKTLAPSKSNSGMMVAIKKLNSESVQGFQEWQVKLSSFMDHLLQNIHLLLY